MGFKLMDMKGRKGAVKKSGLPEGAQTLIAAIIADDNSALVQAFDKGLEKKGSFFNHGYNWDPETLAAPARGVTVDIYYMPSTAKEYRNYETIRNNNGLLSGRRRLMVRIAGDTLSFYTTQHAKTAAHLRDNSYTNCNPIDPSA